MQHQRPVLINVQHIPQKNFESKYIPKNYHESKTLRIFPERSAILFMDVVDGENDIVQTRLKPLLTFARKEGMKVIHAIHEYEVPESMKPLPGEIVIKEYIPNCAEFLHARGINHLIIAGSGTNTCVLDRPCGLLTLKEQTRKSRAPLDLILLRGSTISAERPGTYEEFGNKRMTMNMIEDYVGYTAMGEDLVNAFKASPKPKLKPIDFFQYGYEDELLRPKLESLPVATTWLLVANDGVTFKNKNLDERVKKNKKEFLNPLLELAQFKGIPIIYGFDHGLPKDRSFLSEKDHLVASIDELIELFEKNPQITHLLFAGYTMNRELLYGSLGLYHFRFNKKLYGKYKKLLIEDAVVGFEYPDSIEKQLAKGDAIYWFEINGIPPLNGGEANRSYAISLKDLYSVLNVEPELARVKKEQEEDDIATFYCDKSSLILDIFNPHPFAINLKDYGLFVPCGNHQVYFKLGEVSHLWRSQETRRLSLIREQYFFQDPKKLYELRVTDPRARTFDRGFNAIRYDDNG